MFTLLAVIAIQATTDEPRYDHRAAAQFVGPVLEALLRESSSTAYLLQSIVPAGTPVAERRIPASAVTDSEQLLALWVRRVWLPSAKHWTGFRAANDQEEYMQTRWTKKGLNVLWSDEQEGFGQAGATVVVDFGGPTIVCPTEQDLQRRLDTWIPEIFNVPGDAGPYVLKAVHSERELNRNRLWVGNYTQADAMPLKTPWNWYRTFFVFCDGRRLGIRLVSEFAGRYSKYTMPPKGHWVRPKSRFDP